MGPKKKKNAVIDGVDTSGMSREQLEKFAHNLRNEMEREREERNFFQLERDKLRTFWEITRNQLEEARLTIRAKERDMEENTEMAETKIKYTTQHMKHLKYENETRIAEIRAETMTQLQSAEEDHDLQENELLNAKRKLKCLLREKEEMAELKLEQLKTKHKELLREERTRFVREAEDMTRLHEQKMQNYIEESENRHQMEMFEVEERKSQQMANLIESHEIAFREMRNYYNDITLNNLSLISTLKEQMEELRQPAERNEKIMNEIRQDNKKLTETLDEVTVELVMLRRKMENFDRDRAALGRTKARFSATTKNLNKMKWETETLRTLCQKLTEERDEIKEKFEQAVLEIQEKTSLKNVVLERKISSIQRESQKREAVLGEVLTAAGMEPHSLSWKMENLLKDKNEKIQKLRYELARVCKAHNDLLATYEAKLVSLGVPKEELGFEPIRISAPARIGQGPAGLVAKQR